MPQPTIDSTTQQYLDIHDITNDLVIMKNGTTSLILSVNAMNFGLLAEEEQDSIIYAYAGLLNSLNYPIQILVRSQTKDVTSYLQKLKEQEEEANSRENQQRIRRYREFVANLIHERNVLDKKFYVVIPAAPIELGLLPVQTVIPGQKQFDVGSVERSVLLEKAQHLLEPKRDHLIAQFARIGLYSEQLKTQEIIQLFYLSYNPEASEGQQIAESNSYNTPLVKASFEGVPMFSQNNNNQDVSQMGTQTTTNLPNQAPSPLDNNAAMQNPSDMSTAIPTAPTTPAAANPIPTPTAPINQPPMPPTPMNSPIATQPIGNPTAMTTEAPTTQPLPMTTPMTESMTEPMTTPAPGTPPMSNQISAEPASANQTIMQSPSNLGAPVQDNQQMHVPPANPTTPTQVAETPAGLPATDTSTNTTTDATPMSEPATPTPTPTTKPIDLTQVQAEIDQTISQLGGHDVAQDQSSNLGASASPPDQLPENN